MLGLSHTLEIRSYIERCPPLKTNHLVWFTLGTLESFVTRMASGRFKLRNEAEAKKQDHAHTMRCVFSSLSAVAPEDVHISFQSLDALLERKPRDQMGVYRIASERSVGAMIQDLIVEPVAFDVRLADAVAEALRSGGLRETLRDSRYGGLVPVFEHNIITYFCALFYLAARKDTKRFRNLRALTKIFRSNMPIGVFPGEPNHWLVFIE